MFTSRKQDITLYATFNGLNCFQLYGGKRVDNEENPILIGICPSCGMALKIEETVGKEEGVDLLHCSEICSKPAAMPTGARLQADQATLHFTDAI